ncbi:MAG: HigA family addiction module antitoxin [Methylococcaceae bacterium]
MTICTENIKQLDYSDLIDTDAGHVPMQTPGQILLEDFLKPMGITQYRLAKSIGVSRCRISEIIAGNRSVTVDTGLRLSCFFGLSDSFWTRLQLDYDIEKAKQILADVLPGIHPFNADYSSSSSNINLS